MIVSTYSRIYSANIGAARYPLAESATGADSNGNVLPFDIIGDLSVSIASAPLGRLVWLSGLTITNNLLSFTVSVGDSAVLLGTFARSNIITGKPYNLLMVGDEPAAGVVTFGSSALAALNHAYRFTPDTGELHINAYSFSGTEYVKGVTCDTSDDVAKGDIELIGIDGVDVRIKGNDIIISADPIPIDASKTRPICSIGGAYPDSSGTIEVRFI